MTSEPDPQPDPSAPAPPASPENSYDALPYDSWAFDATHPDRLAAMGRFFGLDTPDVDTCRVLELGCAAGGNLIPMAVSLPRAQFVGVDLSGVQIAEGQGVVEALALDNIELQHRSILDIGPDDGTFDYIVCHGVYSWVPPEVQARILAICSENLSPQGVAYVSYNTLPGWHLRAGVREMMTFHADRFSTVEDRVGQARALLDFLLSAVPESSTSAYSTLLRDELEVIRNRADSYLFHEHLEQHNEPIYFHEFVTRMGAHGLRYLAESSLAEMFPRELPTQVQETLSNICPDQTHMEQYLDFLRNRMFRRTLICHEDVNPLRDLKPSSIEKLLFGAEVKVADGTTDEALDGDELVTFQFDNGGTVHLPEPSAKRMMQALGQAWPAFVDFETLASRADVGRGLAADRPDGPEVSADRARQLQVLLECLSAGLPQIRVAPVRFATTVAERPIASPLARLQASRGSTVTTLRHASRPFPAHVIHLLGLLDGTRTHAQLAESLATFVAESGQAVTIDGETFETADDLRAALATGIERVLKALCWDGLLMP